MANKEIKIEFPEAKLEALDFFMKEKNENVEKEMREHLDKLYDKIVPTPVKKFIEKKMESEEPEEIRQEEAEGAAPRQPRPYRRRTGRIAEENVEVSTSEAGHVDASDGSAEEQEPGMGMSM